MSSYRIPRLHFDEHPEEIATQYSITLDSLYYDLPVYFISRPTRMNMHLRITFILLSYVRVFCTNKIIIISIVYKWRWWRFYRFTWTNHVSTTSSATLQRYCERKTLGCLYEIYIFHYKKLSYTAAGSQY